MSQRNFAAISIAAVWTADSLAAAIAGDDAIAPPGLRRPQQGERRLIAELIDGAIREASAVPRSAAQAAQRDDAREWLRDGLAMMSARYCFEVLGLDYGAAIAKLEAAWRSEAR